MLARQAAHSMSSWTAANLARRTDIAIRMP
ncbi:hypothetical protein OG2516_06576 [Oceanicola granulosus HTCC2516]|uniref:Uncharacterized protein n=1 Tax=Oceanicola granulosus (strain ATCC BAA-861 / DSM 15982 / KCTC 12143 / HTCC2516) TaxID=314256 RepID=Q2CGL1_OCEGH|nr:hypothetical protein OG2516_06576 [Oceanicola granulosus HTCC2516]